MKNIIKKILREHNSDIKDKVLQRIYNKGLFIAGKSVGGLKNLISIIGIDELLQNLKPPFFHNMYNLGASNDEQDKIIEELLSYYLSKDVNVGKIEGLNDGGDIYVADNRGNYIYFESFDGKEWDINEYDDNDNNLYYEDSDGYWKKMMYDDDNIHVYTLDSFGNKWGKKPKKINEGLEDTWNTGNEHGNKYDYQHGYCHYFAHNIIGRLKKLYPNKNIRYYLILADEIYDYDEGEVEQSYLVHAYIKIDDLYLDSNGFSTEDEVDQRANEWYERQLPDLPEDYRLEIWHDEYKRIPRKFLDKNQFCDAGSVKRDVDRFLSHPEVKELLNI